MNNDLLWQLECFQADLKKIRAFMNQMCNTYDKPDLAGYVTKDDIKQLACMLFIGFDLVDDLHAKVTKTIESSIKRG